MKAVIIKKTGGPDVINLEEINLGKPQNDEVLIEFLRESLSLLNFSKFVPNSIARS